MTTRLPETPERSYQPQSELDIVCTLCRAEGAPQVIVFSVQALQPGTLIRPMQFRTRLLGERQEIAGVCAVYVLRFRRCRELLVCKLPHRLQHREAQMTFLVQTLAD